MSFRRNDRLSMTLILIAPLGQRICCELSCDQVNNLAESGLKHTYMRAYFLPFYQWSRSIVAIHVHFKKNLMGAIFGYFGLPAGLFPFGIAKEFENQSCRCTWGFKTATTVGKPTWSAVSTDFLYFELLVILLRSRFSFS